MLRLAGFPHGLQFLPDRPVLFGLAVTTTESIDEWDVEDWKSIKVHRLPKGWLHDVALWRRHIVMDHDHATSLLDTSTGAEIEELRKPSWADVNSPIHGSAFTFSPDGTCLVIGRSDFHKPDWILRRVGVAWTAAIPGIRPDSGNFQRGAAAGSAGQLLFDRGRRIAVRTPEGDFASPRLCVPSCLFSRCQNASHLLRRPNRLLVERRQRTRSRLPGDSTRKFCQASILRRRPATGRCQQRRCKSKEIRLHLCGRSLRDRAARIDDGSNDLEWHRLAITEIVMSKPIAESPARWTTGLLPHLAYERSFLEWQFVPRLRSRQQLRVLRRADWFEVSLGARLDSYLGDAGEGSENRNRSSFGYLDSSSPRRIWQISTRF